ncbi:MAG: RNA polymerase sigma factor [Polyangiales bacterium]
MSRQNKLETLFAEHGRFVYRVARRLGAPTRDVEDITQEVFVVAYRKLEDFDGVSPRGWLFRITARVTADYRKRASNRHEDLAAPLPDAGAEFVDDAVAQAQLRQALDAALLLLKPAEREVFVLYQLEKLPMRECALLIGCPEQTAYSRLKSGRQKVRRHLSRHLNIATTLQEVS